MGLPWTYCVLRVTGAVVGRGRGTGPYCLCLECAAPSADLGLASDRLSQSPGPVAVSWGSRGQVDCFLSCEQSWLARQEPPRSYSEVKRQQVCSSLHSSARPSSRVNSVGLKPACSHLTSDQFTVAHDLDGKWINSVIRHPFLIITIIRFNFVILLTVWNC